MPLNPSSVQDGLLGVMSAASVNCRAGRLSGPGRLGTQRAAICTPSGSCFPGEMREGLGGPEFLQIGTG